MNLNNKNISRWLYSVIALALIGCIGNSSLSAKAQSLALNIFYAGQTYSFAGHYRLITARSRSFSFTLNSGDTIVGAYSGYGSEAVGKSLPSDGMTMSVNKTNYAGSATASYLFTGNGDYFNSSGQLTNDGTGLKNGVMQVNDFTSSGIASLGVGTYQATDYADATNAVGAGLGVYYNYLVVENANLPLQEVVVNTFAIDDYGYPTADETFTIPTKPGVQPAVGQSVIMNTQVSTPDLGDTMSVNLDGVNAFSGLADSPTGSVSVTPTMQADFAAGKLQATIHYSNSSIAAPEVIQGFGISLPMTTVSMNYRLVDESGSLLPINSEFGDSFTSLQAGSSTQTEAITQGTLTLDGILGDTFPHLTAPVLPDYTFVSGPTLNTGGSYSPSATNPNSTATYTYYKNAQHTTSIIDQNGNTLQTSSTSNGSDGTNWQSTVPTISGYSLQDTTGATSGTYNQTTGDTNTTFQLTNVGLVTLHFLDPYNNNQPIQASQVMTGVQLQPYRIIPATISGYRLDPNLTPTSALTGTYQSNSDVNLYYDKQTQVTINMVDASTRQVLKTVTLIGYAGDNYTFTPVPIENYDTPSVPVTGNFTDKNQVITVPYASALGVLTLNYINAVNGQSLLPSEQTVNTIGEWQNIYFPDIPNYTVLNPLSDIAFQQLLPNQTRTIYYDPNLETLTINYVDAKGHTLYPTATVHNYYGITQKISAPTIRGYQVDPREPKNFDVQFNQDTQTLVFRYVPIKETVTFSFVNDAGQKVHNNATITGDYGSNYSYQPNVPWFDQLTYANQKNIAGKYDIEKKDIVVHYTRRQAQIHVADVDNWGNILKRYTLNGFEGEHFTANNPSFWYLKIANPKVQIVRGTYKNPDTSMVILYNHFKTRISVNYYGLDRTFLGSTSQVGYVGTSYRFIAPYSMGYYNLSNRSNYSGQFETSNQVINIYYSYNPPIVYYTTDQVVTKRIQVSSQVSTSSGMNFNEPFSQYTRQMREIYFRAGKGEFTDPSTLQYQEFYKTVYSWENITYHTTQTVTSHKSGTGLTKTPSNNHPGNWAVDKSKEYALSYGENAWGYGLGKSLENVTRYSPDEVGAFADFSTMIMTGQNPYVATVKAGAHMALGVASSAAGDAVGATFGEYAGGIIGTALGGPLGTVIGIGLGIAIGTGLSMLFDAGYDYIKNKRW